MLRGVLGSSTTVVGVVLATTWLSHSVGGRMVALCVTLVGLGLLGSAWLALLARATDVGVATVRRAAFWWSVPMLLAPAMFSRDGWSYAAQGYLARIGLSPYVWGPSVLDGALVDHVDPRWRNTPAPYGPIPIAWGAVASHVTSDPWALVVAHRLLACVGLALLLWAVPKLAALAGMCPARATALGVVSPFTLAAGIGGLHNDLLMVGLACAAVVLAVEHDWRIGCAVVGLAAAVKAPAIVLCLPVVLVSLPASATVLDRCRRALLGGLCALAALALAGLPYGLGFGWVNALGVPGTLHTPLSLVTMVGAATIGVVPARALGVAVLVALLVWWGLRVPTGDRHAAARLCAAVTVALVALSPVVHLWYLLWAVPFVAAVAHAAWQRRVLVVVGVVGALASPLDSSLHGLYLVILGGCATAALAAAILLVVDPHRSKATEFVRQPA